MVLTKRTAGLPLICLVCGDVARGINFDVMTCMSCKAFFRRHAIKFRNRPIKCLLNDRCEITVRTRGACTACRLAKCFQLGMNPRILERALERHHPQRTDPIFDVVPSPRPLNLLRDDRSLMTRMEWTLLSNILHAYDGTETVATMKKLLDDQVALPAKLRGKPSAMFSIVRYLYSTVHQLVSRCPIFYELSKEVRGTLIKNNTETCGTYHAIFLIRETNALDYGAFTNGCLRLYGAETMTNADGFFGRLEPNGTLVKLMLFLSVFSSNTAIVTFKANQSISSTYAMTLFEIQNTIVTMLWKYLIYQFGFAGGVRYLNGLVKYLLDILVTSDRLARDDHWKMMDIIVEEMVDCSIRDDSIRSLAQTDFTH